MTKVKIEEPGFDKFTGDIGGIAFEDGVSVGELSDREVLRVSSSMRVSSIDTGKQIGVSTTLVESKGVEASVITLGLGSNEEAEEVVKKEDKTPVAKVSPYTREELEAIVDKQGIAGLRTIAGKYDVKGRSVAELIDAILKIEAE